MKPDWFACDKCLFFASDAEECYHSPESFPTQSYCLCAHWTCANCWGGYDAWHSRDDESDQDIYVDHTKCQPVRLA